MGAAFLNPENIKAHESSQMLIRVVVVISMAVIAHFLVWLVRYVSDWLVLKSAAKKTPVGFVTQQPKFVTLTGLVASGLTFVIYAVALVLMFWWAFGVNPKGFLTTYLATASVIGLAVGFGSQGLVQDVITGLTLIFSDTLEVGDMVSISGEIGRVEKVGLRFTELRNFYNQQVFLSNRNIANIARFPRGGIHAYVDAQLPTNADRAKVIAVVKQAAHGMWEQFRAIVLQEPDVYELPSQMAGTGDFIRVEFKLWPGQGALIETTFRQRLVTLLKQFDPNYADWMVVVTYRATDVAQTNVSI